MAIESAADRVALLSDWGEDATIGANTVTAIHDTAYLESLNFSGYEPMAVMLTADANANSVADGTSISVGGVDYTVTADGRQDDGTGFTLLMLEEV